MIKTLSLCDIHYFSKGHLDNTFRVKFSETVFHFQIKRFGFMDTDHLIINYILNKEGKNKK